MSLAASETLPRLSRELVHVRLLGGVAIPVRLEDRFCLATLLLPCFLEP